MLTIEHVFKALTEVKQPTPEIVCPKCSATTIVQLSLKDYCVCLNCNHPFKVK